MEKEEIRKEKKEIRKKKEDIRKEKEEIRKEKEDIRKEKEGRKKNGRETCCMLCFAISKKKLLTQQSDEAMLCIHSYICIYI